MKTTLDAILANVADQDRGREFELRDPVDLGSTGIKLRVAGPDSPTQHRARIAMSDELTSLADSDGRVSAENREKARLNFLASCVLGWTISEDGKPVPFSQQNVLRILRVLWVQQQVDAFTANRSAFREAA